jgi:Protein of unknown function (DUF2934)
MVKSAQGKKANAVTPATDRSSQPLQNPLVQAAESDIARRAYALYEKRRREHGRALDDWLQAERELQDELQFYRGVIHERKRSVGVHLQLENSINE